MRGEGEGGHLTGGAFAGTFAGLGSPGPAPEEEEEDSSTSI